jgi:hypothetical protein
MAIIDDIISGSISSYVDRWFQPRLTHPFFDLQITIVPDSLKPIPKRWVEDIEVQIDEGFAEEGDVLGEGPLSRGARGWSTDESRRRLADALARLNLAEDNIQHPNLRSMNRGQLGAEKRRVKQELKRYDSEFRRNFGRLPAHAEKEPMRPLYVYYRRVKTLIAQADQRHGRSSGGGGSGSDDENPNRLRVRESLATIADDEEPRKGSSEIAHLEARIQSLTTMKSSVRQKLQTFQEKFVVENQRKIRFHKDILPIEREYRMYKTVKEDIARLEAQLRELQEENNRRT